MKGKTFFIYSRGVHQPPFITERGYVFAHESQMTDMGGIVNWSVLSTNYLFLVADQPPFVTISNSCFSSNSRSGITIYNLIGQLLIDNTMVRNGGVGLHVNGSQGDLAVYSTKILHNKKHGIHVSNRTGSISLKTVNSSNNQGSGLVFDD